MDWKLNIAAVFRRHDYGCTAGELRDKRRSCCADHASLSEPHSGFREEGSYRVYIIPRRVHPMPIQVGSALQLPCGLTLRSVMYGATKAFLTEFGASLAAEVKREAAFVASASLTKARVGCGRACRAPIPCHYPIL